MKVNGENCVVLPCGNTAQLSSFNNAYEISSKKAKYARLALILDVFKRILTHLEGIYSVKVNGENCVVLPCGNYPIIGLK